MSVSSISFWQLDQNYWSQGQAQSQSLAASDSLITDMSDLMVNQAKGLAGIANQEALTRTNTALTAAIQGALQQTTGNSSSSSSSTSPSSASSASGTTSPTYTPPVIPIPASGTGTQSLATGTPLLSLGIPPQSSFSVSDGNNTTIYTTTDSDTVGDLINALNDTTQSNNAQVSAYLNSNGDLVIGALNNTDSISINGTFAADLGFGASNQSFSPSFAAPSASGNSGATGSSSSAASSSSGAANSSSPNGGSSNGTGSTSTAATGTSSGSTQPVLFNSAYALQTSATAVTLLASGISSSTVNLLA